MRLIASFTAVGLSKLTIFRNVTNVTFCGRFHLECALLEVEQSIAIADDFQPLTEEEMHLEMMAKEGPQSKSSVHFGRALFSAR